MPRRKKSEEHKPPRNDIAVKIDAEVAKIARAAASLRGISLAEYLSDNMRTIAVRDLKAGADATEDS